MSDVRPFSALKTKVPIAIGITLVNDCFQCKNNPTRRNKLVASAGGEADGVLASLSSPPAGGSVLANTK